MGTVRIPWAWPGTQPAFRKQLSTENRTAPAPRPKGHPRQREGPCSWQRERSDQNRPGWWEEECPCVPERPHPKAPPSGDGHGCSDGDARENPEGGAGNPCHHQAKLSLLREAPGLVTQDWCPLCAAGQKGNYLCTRRRESAMSVHSWEETLFV